MRKAILEGLEVEFAMPPLPLVAGVVGGSLGGQLGGWPRGRGRGARLEIAGVVVGQWGGGSYPTRTTRYPQVTQYFLFNYSYQAQYYLFNERQASALVLFTK